MAELLKGAAVAAALDEKTKENCRILAEKGKVPTLTLIRVGEKEADLSYERNILKRCEKVGIRVDSKVFAETVTTGELVEEIRKLNADPEVDGVLFFLPFPKAAGIDEKRVRETLAPEKDVDGCTASSMAGVYSGNGVGYAPCTAQAAMEVLKYYQIPVAGKKAAVVGRSLVVGKPLAMLLLAENATVTVCHSRTEDLKAVTADAQILAACIGKLEMIDASYLGKDQIILDVGINWNEKIGRIAGDVKGKDAERLAKAYTPVPGGIGGVTTSVLASHVAEAAMKR